MEVSRFPLFFCVAVIKSAGARGRHGQPIERVRPASRDAVATSKRTRVLYDRLGTLLRPYPEVQSGPEFFLCLRDPVRHHGHAPVRPGHVRQVRHPEPRGQRLQRRGTPAHRAVHIVGAVSGCQQEEERGRDGGSPRSASVVTPVFLSSPATTTTSTRSSSAAA